MILVITNTEKNDRGLFEVFTSHGIDLQTGRVVILPQVNPESIAEYNEAMGEYVIYEEEDIEHKEQH